MTHSGRIADCLSTRSSVFVFTQGAKLVGAIDEDL